MNLRFLIPLSTDFSKVTFLVLFLQQKYDVIVLELLVFSNALLPIFLSAEAVLILS